MSDPRLRIVQLNAGSLIEPEWDRRRHEVLAWFDRLDPDVVCLQEVWEDGTTPNTAGWLVEHATSEWHWCFGGFPFPVELWADRSMRFGSAILSRWPIDHHELVALPVDDSPHAAADAYYRLEFELLHARTAGLDVFSTHLAPPPAQAYHRIREVLFIDDVVRDRPIRRRRCRRSCAATSTPSPSPTRCASSPHRRARRPQHLLPGRLEGGRARRRPGMDAGPGGNPIYRPLGLPRKRIDYVLVGDPFGRRGGAGRVERCDLAFHEPITGIHASDHYGLVAEIAWPSRP